ncbi:MAG: AmmeMemoRadiSam system radical SAM enzyme [Candidatus Rokubacteria bacterium]|nr:AmmeMemoRadiSam system radical SAM enzyme [Candidatus Rokubacteria bacterium]
MGRVVVLPPDTDLEPDGTRAGGWWHASDAAGRIVCDLCPRACHLQPGARGFCFVRENRDGRMVLTTYGRSTGFCVDPIEKKPLNHFFPGTSVLSFGTAGCNLGCQFCQNWSISKSRETELLSERATPDMIAAAAQRLGCTSVAFTYNDPVIWAEYAIDVARACRAAGVKTVAVTAGYITPAAREPFFSVMDAANVDLKAFTEEFYRRLTLAHLQPVLDTLRWLRAETDVWFEITNLVIPDANDSTDELERMCAWMLDALGDAVPVHFTAFHPDFRLRDRGRTPQDTLLHAWRIARRAGLKYVYVGNVDDVTHQSTYCPHCGRMVIERDWYELGRYDLTGSRCRHCGGPVAGRFGESRGTWGRRRLPVRIAQLAPPASIRPPSSRRATMTALPVLTEQQERAIHQAACAMVAAAAMRRPVRAPDPTFGGAAAEAVSGAFVSLKRRGRLRGCCGVIGQATTVAAAVTRAAARTATEDVRLPAVSPTELGALDLEVWLLSEPEPMRARGEQRRAHVVVGRHGLYARRGTMSGLLLPGVAVEHGLDAERFLEQVCVKANLPPTAWKQDDVEIGTFEGVVIGARFDPAIAKTAEPPAFIDGIALATLADHCRQNLVDLARGFLGRCYLPGGAEGTVHAVSIAVRVPGDTDTLRFSKLSLRPGLPLQATLYELVERAARTIASRASLPEPPVGFELDATVLWDPAMHGAVADPDLDGLDPATRAVLVIEGRKSAWVRDPGATPHALIATAAREAQVRNPGAALVLGLAAVSTELSVVVTDVPRPEQGERTRPAAVAGGFYPGTARDLARMVDGLLPGGDLRREPRPAIMVPHAGLQYSGRIAAATYARVVIPDTVIVLAPRHHRMGAEWAVAPHDVWSIPGGSIPSDVALAHELAEAIPDLALDAVAHQREHAIEVQLPLIARLAPHARVVGIALGSGDLARLRQLATGLADVLRARRDRPLLVISTDLNHFATDAENRRLDAIALAAVERLDPADVYETVVEHRISMCGLFPAVVVLDTLRQLDLLHAAERVAYGTSADVTGDTSRVVGYAGVVFR